MRYYSERHLPLAGPRNKEKGVSWFLLMQICLADNNVAKPWDHGHTQIPLEQTLATSKWVHTFEERRGTTYQV